MTGHVSFAPIAALMFLTGLGIPMLAVFNTGLSQQLGSPITATFVMFVAGVILSVVVMALTQSWPDPTRFTFERPWVYFGAIFMLFYALSITWAAPRIGVGNAVFFVLLGQLIAAATIDHFGLMGAMKTAITARRIGGILIMALGVYLARRPV